MKIQNANLSGTALSLGGKMYQGDEKGVFDLPDEPAEMLLGTPGWAPAGPKEAPKKAKEVLPISEVESPELATEEAAPVLSAEGRRDLRRRARKARIEE
jgi:hypothetical protein